MQKKPILVSTMALSDKLQRCLVNDRDHIGLLTPPAADRRGFHIGLIQRALNTFFTIRFGGGNIIAETGVYDQATADAVLLFKQHQFPPILNFEHKFDNIVGKQTIAALDKVLPPLL